MLMTFRKHAKYFYVLFVIVILSFLGWGVGSQDKGRNKMIVATVGKEDISVEEYARAYDTTVEYYREQYKEKFDDKMRDQLKLGVLGSLIERRVLYTAAVDAGITVSDEELRNEIAADSAFQKGGVFDPEVYHNRLRVARITPKQYEESRRRDLIVDKFSSLIEASMDLNDMDLNLAADIKLDPKIMEDFRKGMQGAEREYAVRAYVEGLKKVMGNEIKIYQENLS